MVYIREEALENLKLYKYSCTDASYMSKYILQPYWNFCINFVPRWIAPNVVTLIGFLSLLVNAATAYYYFPHFEGDAPGWVYLSFAFGIQWYSLLDNLDGRQARRTQNSSPLGELFDHGCDCLAVSLIIVVVCSVTQAGAGLLSFIIFMICEAGFWMATWEEYHTGSLYLGVFNGPTEGLQLLSVFYMLGFFYGREFWIQEIAMPFPIFGVDSFLLNRIILVIYGSVSIVTMFFNFKSVIDYIKKGKGDLFQAFLGLISFAILAVASSVWFQCSSVRQYPYLFIFSIGLCIGELTSRLILAHVTVESFSTIQRPHVLLLLGMTNSVLSHYFQFTLLSDYHCLVLFFVLSLVLFAHYVRSVVYQICNYLDIYCLKINKPKVK